MRKPYDATTWRLFLEEIGVFDLHRSRLLRPVLFIVCLLLMVIVPQTVAHITRPSLEKNQVRKMFSDGGAQIEILDGVYSRNAAAIYFGADPAAFHAAVARIPLRVDIEGADADEADSRLRIHFPRTHFELGTGPLELDIADLPVIQRTPPVSIASNLAALRVYYNPELHKGVILTEYRADL